MRLPAPLPLAALALVTGLLVGGTAAAACALAPLLLCDTVWPALRVLARGLLLGLVLARGGGVPGRGGPELPEGGAVTVVTGVVARVEPPPGGGARLLLDAETAGEGEAEHTWRARLDVDLDGQGYPDVLPSDRVRLALRVRPVPGQRNPGGPDPRRWARVHGVDVWGRVEDPRAVTILARSTGPAASVAAWRSQASAALDRALPTEDAGLARALLLGDRGGLTPEDRERFRAAGQAHLVAVSGQHVALMLAAVLLLARRLGADGRAAALLGLLAVALYVPLTGSPPSAVRSGLGASLWLIGRLSLRQPSGLPLLSAAALAMLALAPTDLLDPGFTLSFGAVLGIELLAPRFTALLVADAPVLPGLLPRRPARLRRLFAVALAAWLGSAGLALFLLGQVNFVAAPLSVPAVPLTAALLAFAALAVVASPVPPLAAVPAWLFGRTADLLRMLLEVPPRLGLSTLTVQPPGPLWLALSTGALAVAGLGPPRLFRWALLAQALLFAAAVAPPNPAHPAAPLLHVLDVGRAPAIVLQLPDGRAALLDAGSRAEGDAGRRTVVPALRALGIARLELALSTSTDPPRLAALADVLAQVPAARYLVLEEGASGVLLEGAWGRLEVRPGRALRLVTAAGLSLPWPSERETYAPAEPPPCAPYHPHRVQSPLPDETLLLFAGGLAAFAFLTVWPLRWLRAGGAVAAWALGVLVAYALGWGGFAALFAPFVVATVLGKLPGAVRDRGRTAKQVLANGLPAAVGVLLELLPGVEGVGFSFFLGSLSCLGADTCATEIGVRYGGVPRSVLSGRPLVAGESGGITSAGLVASLLGALLAPAAYFLVEGPPDVPPKIFAALVGLYVCAGVGAGLLDSVLGATLQYRGRDEGGRVVEARHVGGQSTERVSGWSWLDNDAVNLVAGLAGGALAVGLIALWF